MTRRERVKTALNRQEPDRVPIDNNGGVSGMHETAYKNLLSYLQAEDKLTIYDPTQRLALVRQDIRGFFGVDTWYIGPRAPSFWKYNERPDGSWVDEFGSYYERCGPYTEFVKPVLQNATLEDIKRYKFPNPRDGGRFDGLEEDTRRLFETTDYALVGGLLPNLYYTAWILRGMQQFTEDVMVDPDSTEYLLDKIQEYYTAFADEFLSRAGKYLEIQWVGDDWGLQTAPFLPPRIMKESIVPRFKELISFLKSKTPAKICYHSCGVTSVIMEDFIEMGVDIMHPVQANAVGNENAARLKKVFGNRMMFHGNTNNQGVFHKSREEVVADALYRIRHLAPGGGYVFSSGHNIQGNMPPENILAFFNTAKEYGTYPIDADRIDAKLEELAAANPAVRNSLPAG
ncbi:MAG: hypothetical protein E4H36_05005 [Spirochaetales bacterium]|nr:MAG: hypothetical protein E4H36_05005 [Spirochaetales bacterium]